MKTRTVMVITIVMIGVIGLAGCKKKEPPVAPPEDVNKQAAAMTGEQTICPVMAAPINKKVFVEYKGKKVYFCCAGCEEEFQKNPEKYISKLPQFAK